MGVAAVALVGGSVLGFIERCLTNEEVDG